MLSPLKASDMNSLSGGLEDGNTISFSISLSSSLLIGVCFSLSAAEKCKQSTWDPVWASMFQNKSSILYTEMKIMPEK